MVFRAGHGITGGDLASAMGLKALKPYRRYRNNWEPERTPKVTREFVRIDGRRIQVTVDSLGTVTVRVVR